jgi:putative SOS response-associated peptidase YedK
MCNAYNLRHRNEAILDIARAMKLDLADLPEFPPRHRIGIRQRGLILRPTAEARSPGPGHGGAWCRRVRRRCRRTLNNARADKLNAWPWKAVQRQRCLIPASGFWEPEKPARAKGAAPLSYYSMKDGRPFLMAGLWAEAYDDETGEVEDTYTLIITDANAVMRVHDRMPVILAPDAAGRWLEPGPLPAELLVTYPAEEMRAWRVGDAAKSSRIAPHPGMAEPITAA